MSRMANRPITRWFRSRNDFRRAPRSLGMLDPLQDALQEPAEPGEAGRVRPREAGRDPGDPRDARDHAAALSLVRVHARAGDGRTARVRALGVRVAALLRRLARADERLVVAVLDGDPN